jgi:AcrR family transcriptional regulator
MTRRGSTDPRAITSQRRLVEALTKVVKAEGFGAASVTRIAREAGLSRSGFYEQFASVDELALFILDDLVTEIGALDLEARTVHGADGQAVSEFALELILQSVFEHRELYEHLLLSEATGGTVGRAIQGFARGARPIMAIARPQWPDARIDLMASSIGGLIVSGVMHAFSTGQPSTANDLARELVSFMPPWLFYADATDALTEGSPGETVDSEQPTSSSLRTSHAGDASPDQVHGGPDQLIHTRVSAAAGPVNLDL